jgi:hypothetical protein
VALRRVLLRALGGAAVGAGLVLVWWAIFRAAPDAFFNLVGVDCAPNADLGCALGGAILSVIVAVIVVVAVSIVVGWFVLWAIGVRPAWAVALVGPVLGWVIAWLAEPVLTSMFGSGVARVAVPVALGYGLAAAITSRHAGP